MKPTPIKDPFAAERARFKALQKQEQTYLEALDKKMQEYGFARFDPPKAADFFTPEKVKEIADEIYARVKVPTAEKVDYTTVFDYCEDYIKAMVARFPKPKDGKTPSKNELLEIIRPLIPEAPQAEKVDYKNVELIIKKVLDSLPKKQYVLERSQVVELIKEILNTTHRPQAVRQFVGGTASLRQLTDVILTGVPQDEKGNYILTPGGTGGGHVIEDEGTPLTQRTKLNFVGTGVTVTDDAVDDATVVTINTGSGTGDVTGPASAVDGTPAVFDGTTGKTIKNITYAAFKTLLSLVKADVGLGNVDNTSDANKPVSTAQQTALDLKENLSNKSTSTSLGTSNTLYPSQNAVKEYVDNSISSAVAGLLDDRGNYDASTNLFPSTGGSGTAGAILKGDLWTVSVAGTLGGVAVTIGDVVRALVDTPGQTSSNWAVTENNIGYVAENSANKSTSTSLGTSNTLYPSQNAVKVYADAVQAFAIQRSNHTGSQTASTISDFATTVRSTVLTGLSLVSTTVISATDTVLVALGSLQAQITALTTTVASKVASVSAGTNTTVTGTATNPVVNVPTMTASVGGAVPTPPNNTTTFLRGDGTFAVPPGGGAGSGDVVGPASSTDNAIARYDSTTGKLLQDSVATVSDDGIIRSATNSGANAVSVPLVNYLYQVADYTLTSTVSEQKLFNQTTNGTLTLPAGFYRFNCWFYLTGMAATSGNASFDPIGAGSAVADRFAYDSFGLDNNTQPAAVLAISGIGSVTRQSGTNVVLATTGTGMRVRLQGVFRITTGGTIIPSISLATASAAVAKAGSNFIIEKIGESSEATVGAWT